MRAYTLGSWTTFNFLGVPAGQIFYETKIGRVVCAGKATAMANVLKRWFFEERSASRKQKMQKKVFIYFIYLTLTSPTRAGSPQQLMPITVGPHYLTHPVNFPCGRKPKYPEKTHDLPQSVDLYSFHMRTEFESHWEDTTGIRTRDLRGERRVV